MIGIKSSLEESPKATKTWKNLRRRARRNNYPLAKQVAVDFIKAQLKEGRLYKTSVLEIKMPCGSKAEYKTFDDIPNESTPCPCGNPTHWLIWYERYNA